MLGRPPQAPATAMRGKGKQPQMQGYQPLRATSPERLPKLGRHASPGPEFTKRPERQRSLKAGGPLSATIRTIAPGQVGLKSCFPCLVQPNSPQRGIQLVWGVLTGCLVTAAAASTWWTVEGQVRVPARGA